ncbi:MAG TPA: DUF167 domain-containing protein [Rectinemataceae bacterium]|nr:DUF167 domain-containing protein [Rectinemataceae bacterium]
MSAEARSWLRGSGGRLLVTIKVVPGAARTEIAGLRDGALLARVAAPPEKGKANELLLAALARLLDCPKSDLILVSGSASRRKLLSIPASAETAIIRLAQSARP